MLRLALLARVPSINTAPIFLRSKFSFSISKKHFQENSSKQPPVSWMSDETTNKDYSDLVKGLKNNVFNKRKHIDSLSVDATPSDYNAALSMEIQSKYADFNSIY